MARLSHVTTDHARGQTLPALRPPRCGTYVRHDDEGVSDLVTRLTEVSAQGDPAHRPQARLLLDALQDDADFPSARRDAALLVDAYLNDPYLTR